MPRHAVRRRNAHPASNSSATGGIAATGAAFVASYVVGFLLLGELFGGFADPDRFFVDYYAGDRHQFRDLTGAHLLVVASLALLLFLQQFRRYLQGRGGAVAVLEAAQLCGSVGVALLLTGTAAVSTVTYAQMSGRMTGDSPLTSPAVALLPQFGYVLIFFPAMWALALSIGLIVGCTWSDRILPRWLSWLGFLSATLLPFSAIGFVPVVLLPLWVLSVSIWMFRSRTQAATA